MLKQAKFIRLCRKNAEMSPFDLASKAKLPLIELVENEAGVHRVENHIFFRICAALKVSSEVSLFMELIEGAMRPDIKKARKDYSDSLRSYGFVFADIKTTKDCVVIPFSKLN